MLLLALDTSTPAVTVALHDGSGILAEETTVDARRHGELLATAIARILAGCGVGPGDLTRIGVGTGPGPYTGLRAGLITARVLASALAIGIDGVCSHDVIARSARSAAGGEFIVATDAKRKQVYWSRYSAAGQRTSGPGVAAPGNIDAACPAAGEGPVLYPELGSRPIAPRYPSAAQLAEICAERLARGAQPAPAEPLYLRRPDARAPGKPKPVTPW